MRFPTKDLHSEGEQSVHGDGVNDWRKLSHERCSTSRDRSSEKGKNEGPQGAVSRAVRGRIAICQSCSSVPPGCLAAAGNGRRGPERTCPAAGRRTGCRRGLKTPAATEILETTGFAARDG